MALNANVTVTSTAWTQLTNANAASIRVQNLSDAQDVLLQATSGATEPTSGAGSVVLGAGETLAADLTIAQLWPGVATANRVWGRAKTVNAVPLSVSHSDA